MNRLGLFMSLLLLPALATPASVGSTAYISDELTVPLRSGPSGGHRILHRGLPSGTQLTILDEDADAGFTQIRTSRDTEGWIRTQYLVTQPIAKIRLVAAQREVTQLKQRLERAQAQVQELTNTSQTQASANQASGQEIESLKRELARITEISDSAVQTHEENLQLKDVNARLRDELDDVAEERNMLMDNAANEGIMLGAGFILLGLIAGVLIKARPQRSAWS